MSPSDLRKEAGAAAFLARLVSDPAGRAFLTAKAEVLRRQAERLEARSGLSAVPDSRRRA